MDLMMDETPSRRVSFALRVEETMSDDEILIDDHRVMVKWTGQIICGETRSRLNLSIRTYQHQIRLHKITTIIIISGITLWAHFSQGKAKFDTLLTIINSWYYCNDKSYTEKSFMV